MPRSASVWGTKPWAWRVALASVRWRRRAAAKVPAPVPTARRSAKTRPASRQYLPRVDEAAPKRPAPCSVGAVSVSLVSSSTRSSIVPPSPRSLKATDVKPTSGTAHATTSAAMPSRRRARMVGASRVWPTFTASPPSTSSTAIRTSSRPNSPATLSLTASGWSVTAKASLDSAQAPTRPAPTAGIRSTGRLRSRSGTIANHAMAPRAAAARAPRDWVSRIARIAAPMAG